MEPILTFDVSNQHIRRTDSFRVVAKSKNYLHAKFCFLTEEWNGKGKTALFGDYPAKIPEDEIKSVNESGEIVLSRVVIPEYVVVHDGVPSDNTANNYYVRYRDYIKNVASSEIYATWPDATIRANVLAIMSFTCSGKS